mmetsp:Transcript_14358/g.36225  ORF Transcript_14358/g.36225 Transcript_14358/m.36225 type:complete len:189 (-) Transcript_14358:1322-1888(-)
MPFVVALLLPIVPILNAWLPPPFPTHTPPSLPLSSSWEVFLDGSRHRDFQSAAQAETLTKDLAERPGIYEYCLTLPGSSKHYKVYVGFSKNMRQRHFFNYRKHGSHLLRFFEDACRKGYVVMRRVKYCKSAEKAKALESKLLRRYNYAWNKMENGGKRQVDLVENMCCCFRLSVRVTSKPDQVGPARI